MNELNQEMRKKGLQGIFTEVAPTYQIVNRVFYDFDDRVVARELLGKKEQNVHE